MNDYYSVRINVAANSDADICMSDITDLAASFLADAGFESFEPDSTGLTAYLPASYGSGAEIAGKALEDFPINCSFSISEEFVEGKDWNEEWEKNYFKPILIDDQCVIHSSFHKNVPTARFDILIDPKMAFGTGHHDTTSQMVRFILGEDFTRKSVIDMGTGTGILGILAAMKGAEHVTGIEIDRPAYENAVENVRLNHVAMDIVHGDASALEALCPADYLFANINRNVILADICRYSERLKPGGVMLLSGFFEEDSVMVAVAAAKCGLTLQNRSISNRWTALRLVKTDH